MYARLLTVALLVPTLGACATKRDLRDLQTEVGEMRAALAAAQAASEARLVREIQQQNAAIVDSLQLQDVRLRGDFGNQLVQIERQIVQVQELTGQGQQRLAELRESIEAREEARRAEVAAALAEVSPGGGNPDELFASADAAFDRGSLATARAGFEEFANAFPDHALAPIARLNVGRILERDGEDADAITAYAQVVENHPDAPEAATALLAGALLQREAGNAERARAMLNQLTAAYPRSPEATTARDELRRMR